MSHELSIYISFANIFTYLLPITVIEHFSYTI